MTIVPITNAFVFQFYYLQVIKVLNPRIRKFPFSKYLRASFSLGFLNLLIIFAVYFGLTLWFMLSDDFQFKIEEKEGNSIKVTWSLLQASLNFGSYQFDQFPLIAAIQFILIVQ